MSVPQGLIVLSAPDYTKPWLISGSGRSGTSSLAFVCQALGLRLIHDSPINGEFGPMRKAHESRNTTWMRQFRREWSAGCLVKTPGLGVAAAHDPEIAAALDCNYIFSFRDPIAEAHYDPIQHPTAHVGELARTRARMAEQGVSSAIALSQKTGVLMVSYEKLIQPKSNWQLISHLCTLVAGQPQNLEKAIGVLQPEAAIYRTNLEQTKAELVKKRQVERDVGVGEDGADRLA